MRIPDVGGQGASDTFAPMASDDEEFLEVSGQKCRLKIDVARREAAPKSVSSCRRAKTLDPRPQREQK